MSNFEKLLIRSDASITDAMRSMVAGGEKLLFVVDGKNRLLGVISDGDLRRHILDRGSIEGDVRACINTEPVVLAEGFDKAAAARLMLHHRIEAIPVVDSRNVITDVVYWDDALNQPREEFKAIDCPVVIMAGGRGTRLAPFTQILPKPLIPIGDRPIIEIIMDQIARHGIDKFHISVNHKAHVMKAYFQEKGGRYDIAFIEENEPLGTAGALRFFNPDRAGPILVTNCDTLIDHPLDQILDFHRQSQARITIVGAMYRQTVPYGTCKIDTGGVLTALEEKPSQEFLVNTGMYIVESDELAAIPEGTFFNFTDLIEAAMARGDKTVVFPIDSSAWTDVGQWADYRRAVEKLERL